MGSKNTLSHNYDVFLNHSLLFADGLKDLRNVKEQLYSAAEHFEDSYNKVEQKQMLLESLKNYISKSLIKTIDHLGSLTYKVNKFLDENVLEVSNTKFRVLCIEQRLQTCQAYANHGGLLQQSLLMHTTKYHKQYPVQEVCISEDVKAEKITAQSPGFLRKGSSGQTPTESPVTPQSMAETSRKNWYIQNTGLQGEIQIRLGFYIGSNFGSTVTSPSSLIGFSFTKATSNKSIEKRSRSISPLRFPIKRSGSVANKSTNPIFSASSVLQSISPNLSSNRQHQQSETWRSQSLYPQRQSTKDIKVYSKKTRNLFKAMLSRYKSKNNNI